MKKILFVFSILLLIFILTSWYNATPRVILLRLIKNDTIREGQLRYRVYFLKIFPMGEAILNTERIEEYSGRKVYHLIATANNLRIFSKFFNAHATLDSYIDTQQLNPMLFKQKLLVTDRKDSYREVFYDQVNHIMSIGKVRRQIFPNTQDPLSALFNVRRIDFEKIKDFEININTNQKNYVLRGTAQSREISVQKKTYEIISLKANISRRDKNHYHKSNMTVVLLKEGGNIPIFIDVFTRGILINARLIEVE